MLTNSSGRSQSGSNFLKKQTLYKMPKYVERQMKLIKQPKRDFIFVIKSTLVYGSLAATFSILGTLLPERAYLDNPIVGGLDVEHILGHIFWGLGQIRGQAPRIIYKSPKINFYPVCLAPNFLT